MTTETATIQLNAGDRFSHDGKCVIRANGDRIDLAIYQAQLAYAARPYAVHWRDSHFSATFRFHTLDDAFADIQHRWERIRATVARDRYRASHLRDCNLQTPEGRVSLRYVLLCDDVSSY
jgi:hypothetical protein